jgi:hypothetical protein
MLPCWLTGPMWWSAFAALIWEACADVFVRALGEIREGKLVVDIGKQQGEWREIRGAISRACALTDAIGRFASLACSDLSSLEDSTDARPSPYIRPAMALTDRPNIVIATKPNPARRPPAAAPGTYPTIVYSASAKQKAALRRWEKLTGRI